MSERQLPTIYPETQFYWDGAKAGKLLLQSCNACDKIYYPPRPFCPTCGSRDIAVTQASGKGTLHSFVISHLAAPGYEPPFTIAEVMLEEGVKMMTNIVDCPADPESLDLDMPLELTFEQRGDVAVPQFRPAKGGAA
ncbi:Zn-ribbon domain-containing OB-fold protein [Pseudooceanicola sp.]|uniref:Zn-ribbon domain-containing OB-fold protein n=1 Tax=Pseudooceanicola sp. TaxID=1914328 RepID=UPI002625676D|nr:Zn-ribbon domain-containing OB-fold protein [Pseudooceanicola sp.]MDF1856826.1 Zn-ribbon domain-containing OB-fold protein [Pseudooceanicola sp.]